MIILNLFDFINVKSSKTPEGFTCFTEFFYKKGFNGQKSWINPHGVC